VDIIPRIFPHGRSVQTPGIHLSQRKGGDVFKTQANREHGVAKVIDLVELKR